MKIPWISLVCFSLSLLFFWIWYERYLRWDFNELGRCYDPQTDMVYTESGFVWSIPVFAFLLLSLPGLCKAAWQRFRGKR